MKRIIITFILVIFEVMWRALRSVFFHSFFEIASWSLSLSRTIFVLVSLVESLSPVFYRGGVASIIRSPTASLEIASQGMYLSRAASSLYVLEWGEEHCAFFRKGRVKSSSFLISESGGLALFDPLLPQISQIVAFRLLPLYSFHTNPTDLTPDWYFGRFGFRF